jgi:hypothetical protein
VETADAETIAWGFHEVVVDVLRFLNQAAERRSEAEGLEYRELERAMYRSGGFQGRDGDLQSAVRLLLENGLVRKELEPMYSWDRRRTLGERLAITASGKAYLLRAVEDTQRIR